MFAVDSWVKWLNGKLLTLSLNSFMIPGRQVDPLASSGASETVNPNPSPTPARPHELPLNSATGHAPRTLLSQDLLQGQVEVLISHGDEIYRLRLTRSGKLILQK